VDTPAYASEEAFGMMMTRFFDSINEGNLELIKDMVSKYELKGIPTREANFGEGVSSMEPTQQYSAVLHMLSNQAASN
jgi:hypothetical protein